MKVKEFNKLIKENGAKKVAYMYTKSEINLTNKQLDTVIELKNGKRVK